MREFDIKKKQSDSDFIKSLPSHPGKEFEIKKRLDKLKGIKISITMTITVIIIIIIIIQIFLDQDQEVIHLVYQE